jgi:uncharacterized membrane protein
MIENKSLVIVGNLARNKSRTGKLGIVVAAAQLSNNVLYHVIFSRGEQAFMLENELKEIRLTDAPDEMTRIAPLKGN